MALILAIEPDRRQASQLTAIVRGRLHAELVLGESAERALAALGQRVPDLVLTSALLSPKDETALGERLRALDGAAAYVQTLTIPVLASGSGRGSGRAGGVLSALRRDKPKSAAAPDGCDPAVFAEQCQEYLERAAAERALAEKSAQEEDLPLGPTVDLKALKAVKGAPETAVEPVIVDAAPANIDELADWASPDAPAPNDFQDGHASHESRVDASPSDSDDDLRTALRKAPREALKKAPEEALKDDPKLAEPHPEVLAAEAAAASDTPQVTIPLAALHASPPIVKPRSEHAHRSFRRLAADASGPASLLAAVAALEAEEQVHIEPIVAPIPEPVGDPFLGVRPRPAEASRPSESGEPTGASEPSEAGDFDELDLSSMLDDPSKGASHRTTGGFDDEPVEVYELDNTLLSAPDAEMSTPMYASDEPPSVPPPATGRTWPVLPVLEDLIATTSPQSTAAQSPEPQAAPDDMKQWMDIIEALRRDAEQLPAKQPAPAVNLESAGGPEQTASESTSQDAAAGGKKKRKRGKGSPAQDEWGFFDPDQCGFAALIEKLEEITDKDDTPTPKRA
jgi:hypothetical protein